MCTLQLYDVFLINSLFVDPFLSQSWLWEGHQMILTVRHRGNQTWIQGTSHRIALLDSLWSTTGITTQQLDSLTQAVQSDSLQHWQGLVKGVQTVAEAPLQSQGFRHFPKLPLSSVRGPACSPMPQMVKLTSLRAPVKLCSTCWDWTLHTLQLQLRHHPVQQKSFLGRLQLSVRLIGAWLCPTWDRVLDRVMCRQQRHFLLSTISPHPLRRSSLASSCDAVTLGRMSSSLSEDRTAGSRIEHFPQCKMCSHNYPYCS